MSFPKALYTRVPGAQEEELPERSRRLKRCTFGGCSIRFIYQLFLHVTIITLFVALWHNTFVSNTITCLLPSELQTAAGAVSYEQVIFDPSGFSDLDDQPNVYEGPPSAENNAAWAGLFDVGMFVLNEQEYQQLGLITAELIDRPGEFLVTLEVFHQLHCLDYLRIAAYASAQGKHTHHEQESNWSKKKHLGHCVDYLRQVLMCHGDLTPITLSRRDGRPPYLPNFRIHHTCRNWDALYEYAASRNTSGFAVA